MIKIDDLDSYYERAFTSDKWNVNKSYSKELKMKEFKLTKDSDLWGSIAMSYRHDFGLLSPEEQEKIIFQGWCWYEAIQKEIKHIGFKIIIEKLEEV